jgi:hypothetical protein
MQKWTTIGGSSENIVSLLNSSAFLTRLPHVPNSHPKYIAFLSGRPICSDQLRDHGAIVWKWVTGHPATILAFKKFNTSTWPFCFDKKGLKTYIKWLGRFF